MNKEVMDKIKPGATVRVHERAGVFRGIVLARKHGREAGATFIVRASIAGVGVEKVYPIHSPMISRVEILNSPRKVRRAKLYYLRNLSKKRIRQKIGA